MRVDNEHAAGVVFSTKRALWECVKATQPCSRAETWASHSAINHTDTECLETALLVPPAVPLQEVI